ncbi:hypothetical protein SNE40_013736 [Patella caerulea]|uniref:Uncharacterized protein n=1 Tax=Patella caerulea TaxID=87958 RepID=A0AAN8PFY1_PATCE
MFHQVKVDPDYRNLLRFVWWSDETLTTVTDYRMTVHLFGATSSPGCANYALKETANRFEYVYGKEVADFVRDDFYVDDGLKSVSSPEQAKNLIRQSQLLCKEGDFHLHKFLSNSKEVIQSVPEDERTQSLKGFDINKDILPMERTLGVQWCVESDCFQFKIILKDSPLTRRGILSTVSSIYDPLGLVAPVVLVGKRILQDLCRDSLGWDDDIPDDIRMKWEAWRKDLHLLGQKKIPRCYKPQNFGTVKSVELHNFSDASLIGFGECSYLRPPGV